jgi:hypothetical protein
MDSNLTKAQRRRIRELGGIAYERDLSVHLATLEAEFKKWRAGEIDAFAVVDAVHRFHQGPARDVFSTYQSSNLEFALAHAIHRGLVSESEAGPDVMDALARYLSHLREHDGK